MKRVLACALVAMVGTAAPAMAQSSLGSSKGAAMQGFYRTLPKEIKTNPVVKKAAKDLGLVEKAPEPQEAVAEDCSNCVALTFDDGPAKHTADLLDLLDAKGAKASFMVLGPQARSNASLVKRMVDDGMTVGNHSMSHSELNKLSYQEVATELQQANSAISRAAGITPRWMRPPYGATNANVAKAAGENGMAVAMWQVDTLDWKYRDPERTCRVVVNQSQAGDIVLMHDIHATTVEAVGCIIDGLRKEGLEPVSLDRLVPQPVPGKTYYRR